MEDKQVVLNKMYYGVKLYLKVYPSDGTAPFIEELKRIKKLQAK